LILGSLIKNPIYIGSVQRAVGGRVGFLIIRESFLLKVLAMAQLYLVRQCVSPNKMDNRKRGNDSRLLPRRAIRLKWCDLQWQSQNNGLFPDYALING